MFVLHGGVVDGHACAIGLMNGYASFNAGNHQVFDADVDKCAANHDTVVSAARAVTIEVRDWDALLQEVNSAGRGWLNRASGTDVIGGDGISENRKRAGTADFLDGTGLHGEPIEEGRLLDVSGVMIPLIEITG